MSPPKNTHSLDSLLAPKGAATQPEAIGAQVAPRPVARARTKRSYYVPVKEDRDPVTFKLLREHNIRLKNVEHHEARTRQSLADEAFEDLLIKLKY